MTGFFTVCNRSQLREATALGENIRRFHPNARYVVGLADKPDAVSFPSWFEVLPVESIGIPGLAAMSKRYYDFEFVHATRPWFGRYLTGSSASDDTWIFLAPGTMVYQPLDYLSESPHDFLLTPHITQRLPEPGSPDDKRILNIGMFHSNAWVARGTTDVARFFDWWSKRTVDRAFFDLCNGMCLDQLWLNYTPVHLPHWGMIRSATWHLGLHNARQYPLAMRDNVPTANGEKIATVDFAGLHCFHPVWSDHRNIVSGLPDWQVLIRDYSAKLSNAGGPATGVPAAAGTAFGRPAALSPIRNFRKSVKSELDQLIRLIDKIEI